MQTRRQPISDDMTTGPDGARQFKRFDIHQRIQHWLMLTGFILLVITGWPLKMAGVGGSQALVEFFGGLEMTGTIHRISAVEARLGGEGVVVAEHTDPTDRRRRGAVVTSLSQGGRQEREQGEGGRSPMLESEVVHDADRQGIGEEVPHSARAG